MANRQTHCNSRISFRERLECIIDQAYVILCNKIAGKEIVVRNEASMQMQLGILLKTIGKLYEFSPDDHFRIELETPEVISATAKSKNGARCDIKLAFFEGRQSTAKATAFIELKYFKAPQVESTTETTTDNRFSVLMDMENLERYRDELKDQGRPYPLCYEIVFAENSLYCSQKRKTEYGIGEGVQSKDTYSYKGKVISLKNTYTFHWDTYSDSQYWLKIDV